MNGSTHSTMNGSTHRSTPTKNYCFSPWPLCLRGKLIFHTDGSTNPIRYCQSQIAFGRGRTVRGSTPTEREVILAIPGLQESLAGMQKTQKKGRLVFLSRPYPAGGKHGNVIFKMVLFPFLARHVAKPSLQNTSKHPNRTRTRTRTHSLTLTELVPAGMTPL